MTRRSPISSHLLLVAALGLAVAFGPAAAYAANTMVRITTPLGDIDIELFDSLRPVSVTNFLNYVNDGDYDDSFIHRSPDPDFVIQGGGFALKDGSIVDVPTDEAFQDIVGPSNLRGTIAMAENDLGATSQWFINVVDNVFLDPDFTVFGQVTAGLDVVDAIAEIPIFAFQSPFGELPLIDYTSFPESPLPENFVFATVPEPPGAPLAASALATLAFLRRRRTRPHRS